ncbi:MAG: sigma-70 family RNA polymerase sigma factor [Verrucomicrobiales bacterium]|nr:sigma-70 family RNA polymerase sigma factor [Verrucomicrobiales bacterium]
MIVANRVSSDDFAALYSKCHLELLRYVLTLLPDRHQAEDVVQETARLLWQKFDEYDAARPFWPWARKFAYLEVLKVRKREAIRMKYFSDELVEQLAEERVAHERDLTAQREALSACLDKLDEPARELLMNRYSGKVPLNALAEQQGISANTLYLVMHRIRQKLIECVNRTLRSEGWT